MAQLTLELDPNTAAALRQAAEREGLSQDEWVSRLIRGRLAGWPVAVRQLAGAWPDLPDAETLRRDDGEDLPREPL